MKALFQPGAVVITPGAEQVLAGLGLGAAIFVSNHITGNWGNLDEEDRRANYTALHRGGRVVSAYGKGENRLYVITEADRSVTTILRPEEY